MSGLEAVSYTHAGTALVGYLARPEGVPRGAIVIFPTIVNVNDHMRKRARMLADAGYLVMIADFYGEPVASFAAAGPLANDLRSDPAFYRARLAVAIRTLRDHPSAERLQMAAIGYCMGGGAAIETARDGQDLIAAISFHGLLGSALPAQQGAVKARLLVLHGEADPMVPREQVFAFQDEMTRAGADWHFHSYSGVKHGFTDPESDLRDLDAVAYNASADRQSWAAMLSFLDEVFAGDQA